MPAAARKWDRKSNSVLEAFSPPEKNRRREERLRDDAEEVPQPTAKNTSNVVFLGKMKALIAPQRVIEIYDKMPEVPNPAAWRHVTLARIEHNLQEELED